MVWYSHLFKNFPQFVVIHTAKVFGIVNKAEIDVFLEFSGFFDDPVDIGNLLLEYIIEYLSFLLSGTFNLLRKQLCKCICNSKLI